MVSVFVSSAVGREFEPRSGLTKDYKIGMCCFSAKHVACCFSQLALYKSNSADLIIISLIILACSRHDIAEQLLN
jgi:hypothetical protein